MIWYIYIYINISYLDTYWYIYVYYIHMCVYMRPFSVKWFLLVGQSGTEKIDPDSSHLATPWMIKQQKTFQLHRISINCTQHPSLTFYRALREFGRSCDIPGYSLYYISRTFLNQNAKIFPQVLNRMVLLNLHQSSKAVHLRRARVDRSLDMCLEQFGSLQSWSQP